MTADHRGESGKQRTVAELLKQYGGDEPAGPRRRRRAAEPDESPPAPPAQRTTGQDGSMVDGGSVFHSPASHSPAPHSPGPHFPGSHFDAPTGRSAPADYGPPEASPEAQSGPPTAFDLASGSGWSDGGPGSLPNRSYQGDIYRAGLMTPGVPPGGQPEESTDFIPRYDRGGRAAGPLPGPGTEDTGPRTAIRSRAELFDDEDDEPVNGFPLSDAGRAGGADPYLDHDSGELNAESDVDTRIRTDTEAPPRPPGFLGRRLSRRGGSAAAEPDRDFADHDPPEFDPFDPEPPVAALDAPAGLTDRAEPEDLASAGRPSRAMVWLALVGQWIVGALVGAGLWVGFRYLWLNHPVIALVAAVVATAGLVLLVRAIRRSDDVQTTMLAVLVGLVVTISPAVLLLTSR